MRAVVGSILLLLAVCLVSLGVYFWTAPTAQPTETPVIAAEVTTVLNGGSVEMDINGYRQPE